MFGHQDYCHRRLAVGHAVRVSEPAALNLSHNFFDRGAIQPATPISRITPFLELPGAIRLGVLRNNGGNHSTSTGG